MTDREIEAMASNESVWKAFFKLRGRMALDSLFYQGERLRLGYHYKTNNKMLVNTNKLFFWNYDKKSWWKNGWYIRNFKGTKIQSGNEQVDTALMDVKEIFGNQDWILLNYHNAQIVAKISAKEMNMSQYKVVWIITIWIDWIVNNILTCSIL